jgi:hypothetical protein
LAQDEIFGFKPRAPREPRPDNKQQVDQKRDHRSLHYHTTIRASSRIRFSGGTTDGPPPSSQIADDYVTRWLSRVALAKFDLTQRATLTVQLNEMLMGTLLFLYSEFDVRPLTDYGKYMENVAAALEKRGR